MFSFSYFIYTGLGYLIYTTYQFNSQSMVRPGPDKRKLAIDSRFVRKKIVFHGIILSRGKWVLPENYNCMNSAGAHFITKKIELKNMNLIRAYITITMWMTSIKRTARVTAILILEVTAILIAKVTGTTKRYNIRKKCYFNQKYAAIPNNLGN